MIAHADLHVHSKFSGISPDWYLRLVNSAESYSEVDTIFFRALKRGQTFVTVTDHDQIMGSLRLKEIYPARVFTGVEFNVYFPEDRCKVHILVYGLSEQDYTNLMALRHDIYQFRDYLKQSNLAYSVAHALMALDKMSLDPQTVNDTLGNRGGQAVAIDHAVGHQIGDMLGAQQA